MRILILEDDTYRINVFVDMLHTHELTITENAYDAIEHLTTGVFDVIFLDHDLGKENGTGSLVSSFLRESIDNKNSGATVFIHSWNMVAVQRMHQDIPGAIIAPFATDTFYSIRLPK